MGPRWKKHGGLVLPGGKDQKDRHGDKAQDDHGGEDRYGHGD